ncbi:hypothetical protein NS14008_01760 [Nocardia seriolae]|nr:hypothetical protein NS14008_01760 [Nocardia seriolae]PSK26584.1 hypothetical protein C6575_36525 [Nocardia seriolae]RLP22117.1 hypothetical protein D6158_36370 [Nocardia seriolae]
MGFPRGLTPPRTAFEFFDDSTAPMNDRTTSGPKAAPPPQHARLLPPGRSSDELQHVIQMLEAV